MVLSKNHVLTYFSDNTILDGVLFLFLLLLPDQARFNTILDYKKVNVCMISQSTLTTEQRTYYLNKDAEDFFVHTVHSRVHYTPFNQMKRKNTQYNKNMAHKF